MTEPTIEEKTSYCDSVPCTIHDHSDWLDRVKNYHHSQPSVSALEQFNEEVMKEIPDHVICGHCNVKPTMQDFITQKLTEHKELILKMVREKAPEKKDTTFQCLDTDREIGWNECRQEFLNNLDTI